MAIIIAGNIWIQPNYRRLQRNPILPIPSSSIHPLFYNKMGKTKTAAAPKEDKKKAVKEVKAVKAEKPAKVS